DADRDWMNDLEESIAGTDPWNSASTFHVSTFQQATNREFFIQWPITSGRLYRLYFAPGVLSNNTAFQEIGDPAGIVIQNDTASYSAPLASTSRTYRLDVRRSP
ncbi:MAG: hypothetical protein V2A34_07730, partial [Lentisphaerota bacterium]